MQDTSSSDYATRRMVAILQALPASEIANAVALYAPGAEPGSLTYEQIARTLGVTGVAGLVGMPPFAVMQSLGGAENCGRADLIDPNPEFANGYHAVIRAYQPAMGCGCAKAMGGVVRSRSMGDLGDIIEMGSSIFGAGADASETIEGEEPAPQLSGDGWPAAPPFRAGNWRWTDTGGEYTLAQGDTLSGLARLYLGRPARWTEIWALQPYRWERKPDPSSKNPGRPIMEGDVLIMPQEAADNAALMVKNKAPSAPATGGAPGTVPGQNTNGISNTAPSVQTSSLLKWGLIAGGAAVVLVGGVLVAKAAA